MVVLFDNVVNPDTFNDDDNVTLLDKLEYLLVFNVPNMVVLFDNVVNPETFNEEFNVTILLKLEIPVIIPLTFNIPLIVVLFDYNVLPLTFKANIPGPVVFIHNPVAVIICLSNPFILYVILPEFIPGVGSPPLSSLINTSLLTFAFEFPKVFKSMAVLAPFLNIRL